MYEEVLEAAVATHGPDAHKPFDYEGFKTWLHHKAGSELDLDGLESVKRDEIFTTTLQRVEDLYEKRKERTGAEKWAMTEKLLLLDTIDTKWKDHLHAMDALKDGIGLRGYAQLDPKNEYKKEGYKKFELLKQEVAEAITNLIFKVELSDAAPRAQPAPRGPRMPQGLPNDPIMAQAYVEAMAAAGQLPPEIAEAIAKGARVTIETGPPQRQRPPAAAAAPERTQPEPRQGGQAGGAGREAAAADAGDPPGSAQPAATATAEGATAGATTTPEVPAEAGAPPEAPVAPAAAAQGAAPAPASGAGAGAAAATRAKPGGGPKPGDPKSGDPKAGGPKAGGPKPGGPKPGRNSPCPCGSGLKYKKCCAPAFD
jgi:hypothetical protein